MFIWDGDEYSAFLYLEKSNEASIQASLIFSVALRLAAKNRSTNAIFCIQFLCDYKIWYETLEFKWSRFSKTHSLQFAYEIK